MEHPAARYRKLSMAVKPTPPKGGFFVLFTNPTKVFYDSCLA
jgi:hypothetical protein